jgi:hypothetical protein
MIVMCEMCVMPCMIDTRLFRRIYLKTKLWNERSSPARNLYPSFTDSLVVMYHASFLQTPITSNDRAVHQHRQASMPMRWSIDASHTNFIH